MDMKLHWLQDRENKNQFKITWKKGADIRADYITKNHPAVHHRKEIKKYLSFSEVDVCGLSGLMLSLIWLAFCL